MSNQKIYQYQDLTEITKWVKIVLKIEILITIIAMISDAMELSFMFDVNNYEYASVEAMRADFESHAVRQSSLAVLYNGIYTVTAVLFLYWVYLASRNAHAMGAKGIKHSPWSVIWFLVPIAHLWKPYKMMKEIWQTSRSPLLWKDVDPGTVLAWWWMLWLVSIHFGKFTCYFPWGDNEAVITQYCSASIIMTEMLDVFLYLILIHMVTEIWDAQIGQDPAKISPESGI